MLISTILNIIVASQLLTTLNIYVSTLPITSKPIEGTAEHLAWQAWLMLPPDQKNLEKSRKVTPKSIFTLPFRECPEGHQLFENRCIPTVNIDQAALLTQQLLGFVVGDNNGDNNYEFDYDDIGVDDEIADIMYEPAQKLNGDNNSKDTYHYDQLPSQDEPLKFNIFQQKFPTDYEADTMSNDEPEEQTAKTTGVVVSNATTATPLAEAVNALTANEPNLNSTQAINNSTADLQMESSSISMNIAEISSSNKNDYVDVVTPATVFSISDIDAIVLPAVPTHNSNLESESVSNKQNVHKFSLFKDDSSVQLVTSTLLAERSNEKQKQKQPDLALLLKADDLLPLPNITTQKTVAGNTDNGSSSTATTVTHTRTSSIFSDNEVSTLSTLHGVDTTTLLSDNNGDLLGEGTDMMLSDTEATLPPTLIDDSLENSKKVARPGEPAYSHLKKGEHPRSVTMSNATSSMTEAQEENFTTTTEPDMTTNFQVDETTVDEVHDAPAIALKELLELAQHPIADLHENLGVVVKKSKVEPVELPPSNIFTEIEAEAETVSSVTTTSMRSAPTSASPTNFAVTKADEAEVTASSTAVMPTALSTQSSTKTDRFDNQRLDISSISSISSSSIAYRSQSDERQRNANSNDEQRDDSNFRNIETATKPTTQTSEIDIKQELRMINELVKGNSNKRKQQIKGGIIKSETSNIAAESGLTSVVKKSAKSTALNSKDKIAETIIQQSTTKKEESRTSTAVTVTTTTTPIPMNMETTTIQSATAATSEPTSTIWSKIMPLLGFSTSFDETSVETTENTSTKEIATSTEASTTSSRSGSSKMESSINSNRSNRNSKIIRINSLSTTSFSNSNSNSDKDKDRDSSTLSNRNIVADKLVFSTTEPSTTTATTEINDSSSSSSTSTPFENDPFWWLPIGWRLDRTSDNEDVGEPSLLLRFWSTIPESESTEELGI